ncbi:MAG: CopG family ribbon-helix-helix protein [Nitrososphaerota archaeon]|nr:CopG family ribbon-helix-helix protein [Nitrososphaerota archaeon]MDG7020958.1 CopG family ribbon-helix-helix protein [Nitrososphaerota archaeon]
MTVVSLSFPDSMLKEMDTIQKESGFTGRSELVRAAIRMLLEDSREKAANVGDVNGLLIVTHDEDEEAPVTKLKHQYEDIITTHVHNKTKSAMCIELFLVQGDAKKVNSMTRSFQAEDKMKSTKFVSI